MRKSVLEKEKDKSIFFKILVAMLWTRGVLMEYIRSVLLKVPGLSSVANYLIPALIVLAFFLSYRTITERIRGADLIFIMACILIYAFEFWVFPKNRPYFEVLYSRFLLGCLPFYFVGVAIRGDDKELIQWMYRVSCASIIAFIIYMFFVNQMDSVILRGGDMSSAYNILPHACLSFYFMMKDFGWRRLAVFLLGAVGLVMMGTRGAVLCLLIYMFVTIIMTKKLRNPLVLIGMAMVVIAFLFFSSLTDAVINGAYSIADTFGLSTRIFDKMLSGNITNSSGRIYIRDRILYYLQEYRITGLGIYGDVNVSEGMYAHNIFLEILAHYGYYIGSLLIAALIGFLGVGIAYCIKSKDENAQIVVFLLLGCCCKLLLSSSYLREPLLWVLLGYITSLIREKRTMAEPKQDTRGSKYIR